jgi:hypothetical protein
MTQGGQANIGLPGILGVGPFAVDASDVSFRQGGTTNTSFSGSSDFVIGYRLGKITFEKSAQGLHAPKHQRHVAGAMLGLSEGRKNQDSRLNNDVEVIFEGEDALAKEFSEQDLVAIAAIDEDDDRDCQCFIVPLPGTDQN